MNPSSSSSEDPWEAASFKGARRAQARESARLSFEERLRWVCEMSEVIRARERAAGRDPPALRDRYGPPHG